MGVTIVVFICGLLIISVILQRHLDQEMMEIFERKRREMLKYEKNSSGKENSEQQKSAGHSKTIKKIGQQKK